MNDTVSPEVLDDLVQIVTHRIASLTAGVEGYADVLVETLNTPEQRRLARHILEGVARINGVVEDLRFFVQPIEPVVVPMRVSSLVTSALNILSDSERARVTAPSRIAGRVVADPHLSRQALHALLRNALDASGSSGEVRLEVRREDDDFAVIRVWNSGRALSRTEAARAVEPFYTTKAQNLGLGLPLARRMARAQGGDVDFEAVEAGTAVVFRLPRPVALDA
ncbi:MAG TPA: ATP-binding protein [Rhodothermales bacterium]